MRHCLIAVGIVAVLASGCGGGGSGTPASPSQVASLTGTWRATRAEFVNAASSGTRQEIVAQGSVVTLVLDAGTFKFTIADPGLPGNVTSGTWSATTDVLKLTPSGMSWSLEFDMTLSGNTLTLNGASVEFDFGNDGRAEQAKLYMTMTRQ